MTAIFIVANLICAAVMFGLWQKSLFAGLFIAAISITILLFCGRNSK